MNTRNSLLAVFVVLAAVVVAIGLTPVKFESPDKWHFSIDTFLTRLKFRVSRTPFVSEVLHWTTITQAYVDMYCRTSFFRSYIDQIDEHLYLGNICAAHSEEILKERGVDTIVNMCHTCPNKLEATIVTKSFPIADVEEEDLLAVLSHAVEYIETAINAKQKVFVHCKAGVSRSGAVVVAYIMKSKNMTFFEALHYVRQRRGIVNPNPGFQRQLLEYEQTLLESRAAAQA